MRQLFRFFAWVLSQAFWLSFTFIASTMGVYFAYGVASAELSYLTCRKCSSLSAARLVVKAASRRARNYFVG
jgi:hypothetical protein